MNVLPGGASDLPFAVLCLGLALSSPAAPQAQPDPAWMGKTFAVAFDDFFPIQHGEGDFIAVRAHRDGTNDLPEFSIVLDDTQNARATHATLREAQGSSLYQQLAALHAKDPSKSYAELKPDLKVQTWNLTAADQCPAIAAQLKAFGRATMIPSPSIPSFISSTNRWAVAIPRSPSLSRHERFRNGPMKRTVHWTHAPDRWRNNYGRKIRSTRAFQICTRRADRSQPSHSRPSRAGL